MKQKVIIYGEKVEKNYYFGMKFFGYKQVCNRIEHIEWVEVFNGEIDNPPFSINDNVFISSLNKSIKVTKVARNVDGGYVYWTDHISEEVENVESREKAINEYAQYLIEIKKAEDESVTVKPESKSKKVWFKFRKAVK